MIVFWVRSLSSEPLVRFTNNFPEMLAMMRRCAVPMFDQGQFTSSPSSTKTFVSIQWHTGEGRQDCFRFRKHPSCCCCFCCYNYFLFRYFVNFQLTKRAICFSTKNIILAFETFAPIYIYLECLSIRMSITIIDISLEQNTSL